MDIIRETVIHDGPGGTFEAMAVRDRHAPGPQAGVLLVPNILGPKEADFAKAERIAALGYVVLVADLYGQGNRPRREDPDMRKFMDALLADRGLLLQRLDTSLQVLKAVPGCDATRLAAIGFCFGGLCVLDMARAGLDVRCVVSFHGLFGRPHYDNVHPIRAGVLICHGWDDPLCPPDSVAAIAAELTQGKADWQIHAYGNAGHAFTDTESGGSIDGFGYDANADERSWSNMVHFMAEKTY